MKSSAFTKFLKLLSMSVLALGLTSSSMYAETKKDFKIAWTIYAGWMPWDAISSQKIMDKRDGHVVKPIDVETKKDGADTAPAFYALLPMIPLVLILVFRSILSRK